MKAKDLQIKSNRQREGGEGIQMAERSGDPVIAKSGAAGKRGDADDHKGSNNEGKEANEQQPRRILWVKKNQIDPTAVLSYGLGVSIVHFAMAITTT
jgi:hypothetical protein